MASKGNAMQSASPRLTPSCAKDSSGVYTSVTCGKISGQLYLDRLARKPTGKCVLVGGQWYSPPEVESLGGKKARKWRQSLLHNGKPLADYDLTYVEQSVTNVTSPQNRDTDTPPCSLSVPSVDQGHISASRCSDSVTEPPPSLSVTSVGDRPPQEHNSIAASCSSGENTFLVDAVLSFIKAFRLKGDNDSLKLAVSERFSPKEVESGKKHLWDNCVGVLEANGLAFHARRDSDRRSQLAANLEDIIHFFEVLDSVGKIPPIFCEASDLLRLPPLSLDPLAEEVRCNSASLKHLADLVERLETKFSSLIDSKPAQHSGQVKQSYATVVSSASHSQVPSPLLAPPRKNTLSSSLGSDGRDLNLILFGVPEGGSILQAKKTVDEVFEFLTGKQVQIKDIFRLGRFNKSDSPLSRPRPLLIKLCTAWDRKLVLIRRFMLKDFHLKRLFVREDVAPDHKLRQRQSAPPPNNAAPVGSSVTPCTLSSQVPHPENHVSSKDSGNLVSQRTTSSRSVSPPACPSSLASFSGGRGSDPTSISNSSFVVARHSVVSSASPTCALSRSVSPSASSSTVVTGDGLNRDGSS